MPAGLFKSALLLCTPLGDGQYRQEINSSNVPYRPHSMRPNPCPPSLQPCWLCTASHHRIWILRLRSRPSLKNSTFPFDEKFLNDSTLFAFRFRAHFLMQFPDTIINRKFGWKLLHCHTRYYTSLSADLYSYLSLFCIV